MVFTSDYADALGDHGHIQKWTMYDCVERVPLVFWSPRRIRGGGRTDTLVQLIDVAPTILQAAGVPVPENWEARSLWPVLDGSEPRLRGTMYAELARDCCAICSNGPCAETCARGCRDNASRSRRC